MDEMNVRKLSNAEENGPPFWYVFHCVASTETRGNDPNRDRTNPCGRYQVWKRRKVLKDPFYRTDRATQAKCPECGNRPRLTRGMVVPCRDLSEAMARKAAKNAELDARGDA